MVIQEYPALVFDISLLSEEIFLMLLLYAFPPCRSRAEFSCFQQLVHIERLLGAPENVAVVLQKGSARGGEYVQEEAGYVQ